VTPDIGAHALYCVYLGALATTVGETEIHAGRGNTSDADIPGESHVPSR